MWTKTLAITAAALAANMPAASLTSLIQQAGTIVIGAENAPTKAGTVVTFSLSVEQVFAGSVAPGQTLTVDWDSRASGPIWRGSPSYRGLWFLQGITGVLQCIPAGRKGLVVFFPDLSFPVGTGPLPPQLGFASQTTAIADQLALEIAAGQLPQPLPLPGCDLRHDVR